MIKKNIIYMLCFPLYGITFSLIYTYISALINQLNLPLIIPFSIVCVVFSIIIGILLGIFKKGALLNGIIKTVFGIGIAFICFLITTLIQWHFTMSTF